MRRGPPGLGRARARPRYPRGAGGLEEDAPPRSSAVLGDGETREARPPRPSAAPQKRLAVRSLAFPPKYLLFGFRTSPGRCFSMQWS